MSAKYDSAQVCLNGHVITAYYSTGIPEDRQDFCHRCGAQTILQCPGCDTAIRGAHIGDALAMASYGGPPAYCRACGKPFPWTERRLQAARELAEQADELDTERDDLVRRLPDLVSDTPMATVAATKWRTALTRVTEHTALAFKQVFIEVASETAKKMLFPAP
jgi:hypothetical protein